MYNKGCNIVPAAKAEREVREEKIKIKRERVIVSLKTIRTSLQM